MITSGESTQFVKSASEPYLLPMTLFTDRLTDRARSRIVLGKCLAWTPPILTLYLLGFSQSLQTKSQNITTIRLQPVPSELFALYSGPSDVKEELPGPSPRSLHETEAESTDLTEIFTSLKSRRVSLCF